MRLKRSQNYSIGEKQPIINELWAVYGILFLLSAHTKPIYPTHLAGNPYTVCMTDTIFPILCLLIL